MFSYYFCLMIERSGSVSLTNGGPKTYGSYGSGSATLLQSLLTEVCPFPLVRYWQARFASSIQTGHEKSCLPAT
jgi:hypothetical protein